MVKSSILITFLINHFSSALLSESDSRSAFFSLSEESQEEPRFGTRSAANLNYFGKQEQNNHGLYHQKYLRGPRGRRGFRGLPGRSCDFQRISALIDERIMKIGKSHVNGKAGTSVPVVPYSELINFSLFPETKVNRREKKFLKFTGDTKYVKGKDVLVNNLNKNFTKIRSVNDKMIFQVSINLLITLKKPFLPKSLHRLKSNQRIELKIKKFNENNQLYDKNDKVIPSAEILKNDEKAIVTAGSVVIKDFAFSSKLVSLSLNHIFKLNENDFFVVEIVNKSRKWLNVSGEMDVLFY